MFAATLAAEVDGYLAEMADPRDKRGRRLMVRNVHACSRQVITAADAVEATAAQVNDRRGEPANTTGSPRRSCPDDAGGRRSTAAAVPARPVLPWHATCAGAGPRLGCGPVRLTRIGCACSSWSVACAPTAAKNSSADGWLPGIGWGRDGAASARARRGMPAPVFAVGDGTLEFWRRCAMSSPVRANNDVRSTRPAGPRAALSTPASPCAEKAPGGDLHRRGPDPHHRRGGVVRRRLPSKVLRRRAFSTDGVPGAHHGAGNIDSISRRRSF